MAHTRDISARISTPMSTALIVKRALTSYFMAAILGQFSVHPVIIGLSCEFKTKIARAASAQYSRLEDRQPNPSDLSNETLHTLFPLPAIGTRFLLSVSSLSGSVQPEPDEINLGGHCLQLASPAASVYSP